MGPLQWPKSNGHSFHCRFCQFVSGMEECLAHYVNSKYSCVDSDIKVKTVMKSLRCLDVHGFGVQKFAADEIGHNTACIGHIWA
jgi:hypothetical protein